MYTRLYDVCKLCNVNIKATGPNIPKFSLLGGFDFGIPVPACMIGLSFAEQSMLARIQVVICFSTLPNGSQKAKGSAGFIDRSDFAMQVATRLPWHPSTIPYLALLNETPGANPGEPPKLKELRCRRAVLQICLAF